ncbi:g11824 [Coccomyxa elongata]
MALIGQAPFTLAASADTCVSATMNMVGVCGSFVSKVQNAAKTLVGAPDADIAAAAAQIPPPTTQCCGVYRDFLSAGCNCDKGVLALAAAQSTPEQAVATQTRVWKVECNIAPSFDHCTVAASASTLG